MAGRESALRAPVVHKAGERPAGAREAPVPGRRCPGAAAQLEAVHRTLRRGPVLQLQTEGEADRMGIRAAVPVRPEEGDMAAPRLRARSIQRAVAAPVRVTGGSLSLVGREIGGASDGVVQLSTVNFGIDAATGAKFITMIKLDRVEEANFATGAGDHGTAHIVFRHWAENELGGMAVAAVGGIFDGMIATVKAMPGYGRATTAQQQEALQMKGAIAESAVEAWKTFIGSPVAKTDAQIAANIIATALHILNFRNGVPLSTLEFGSVGHGEGHAANLLDSLNYRIATGGPAPSAIERAAAIDAVVTLFDIKAFSEFTADEDRHDALDAEMLPGAGPGAYNAAIAQHLLQIAVTYPRLWAVIAAAASVNFRRVATRGGDSKDPSYGSKAKK